MENKSWKILFVSFLAEDKYSLHVCVRGEEWKSIFGSIHSLKLWGIINNDYSFVNGLLLSCRSQQIIYKKLNSIRTLFLIEFVCSASCSAFFSESFKDFNQIFEMRKELFWAMKPPASKMLVREFVGRSAKIPERTALNCHHRKFLWNHIKSRDLIFNRLRSQLHFMHN